MPSSLHRELAEQAQKEGVSLNSYLLYLLSKNFGKDLAAPAEQAQAAENILMVGEPDTLYQSQSPVMVIDPVTIQQ